jgi:uncharacterized membrane protein
MPNKLQIALIVSIAANAALLGIVGGRMVVQAKPPQEASEELPREGSYRPVSSTVQAAWAQLPQDDRIVLRDQFRALGRDSTAVTKKLQASAARIAEIARTEPFDGEQLRDIVVVYRHLQAGQQERVDDILVSHLEHMPPEAREIAARGLLTPYYSWMRPPQSSAPRPPSQEEQPGPAPAAASHTPAPSPAE